MCVTLGKYFQCDPFNFMNKEISDLNAMYAIIVENIKREKERQQKMQMEKDNNTDFGSYHQTEDYLELEFN